jgi:hypothetical protein
MAVNTPTGFRNKALANNSSSAGIIPDYEDYEYEVPMPVALPAPPVNSVSIGDNNNGSEEESRQLSLEQAKANIAADRVPDQIKGQQMFGPKLDPRMALPGAMFMGINDPAVPQSGYGADGTYSSLTGGQFSGGRSFDPITGAANQEYANRNSFLEGNYVTNLKDNIFGEPKYDPFGDVINNDPLGAFFSDPDNAYNKSNDPSAGTGAYQQAIQNSNKEGSANFGMGTLSNQNKIVRKIGMDDGIPEHSLVKTRIEDDGTKTILGTTKQGAQIKGQDLYLPTFGNIEGVAYGSDVAHGMDAKAGEAQGGVYSTMNSYEQDDGSSSGTTSATATSGRDTATSGPTGTSYADDAQSSGSGSGGGK